MALASILTPNGIATFLNLEKPRAVTPGDEPRYGLSIIFDKEAQASPRFKSLEKAIDAAVKERWSSRIPPGLRSPFRDCAEKAGVYEGYKAGDLFISPWSKNPPGCIDRDKNEIVDWRDYWSGWVVRANIRPFAYETSGNKGVGLFLDSVQFIKPGKRLDGRKPAKEAFPDDLPDEDEQV